MVRIANTTEPAHALHISFIICSQFPMMVYSKVKRTMVCPKRVSLHMQNKSFHVYSNRSRRILFGRALLTAFAVTKAHNEQII